jgi:hypothetical protein
MNSESEATRLLNVDLELIATFDLVPWLETWGTAMITLRDSVDDGRRTVGGAARDADRSRTNDRQKA